MQTLELAPAALVLAVPIGALATSILVVNNLRDQGDRRRAGKRTLAVRMGAPATRVYYAVLLAGAHGIVVLAWALGLAPGTALVVLGCAPWSVSQEDRPDRRRGPQPLPRGDGEARGGLRGPPGARGADRLIGSLGGHHPPRDPDAGRLPFRRSIETATSTLAGRDGVVVGLETTDGLVGWGETPEVPGSRPARSPTPERGLREELGRILGSEPGPAERGATGGVVGSALGFALADLGARVRGRSLAEDLAGDAPPRSTSRSTP